MKFSGTPGVPATIGGPIDPIPEQFMDIQRALFEEIVTRPTDDVPWMVLADWFEDLGETFRAELVRLSIYLRNHEAGPERLAREIRLRELYALGLTFPLPKRRIAVGANAEMELVFIPPGQFLMGSPAREAHREPDEGPEHLVRLTRGFWLGSQQVTQGQWHSLLGSPPPGQFRGIRLPVAGVSWVECQEFLAALSRHPEHVYRLPTEAEWEYACRALTSTPFSHGTSLSSHQANFDGNSPYGGAALGPWISAPMQASYLPNGFGLHDMHGNVWEWCADWFAEDYYASSPIDDPPGLHEGSVRVLRGGSWYSHGWSCRSANRERSAPESGTGNYGFRVAMTEPGQSFSP